MPSSPVPKVPGAPAAPCAPRHTRLHPSLTEAACSHCVPGVLDFEETAEIVQHEGGEGRALEIQLFHNPLHSALSCSSLKRGSICGV